MILFLLGAVEDNDNSHYNMPFNLLSIFCYVYYYSPL